jgi:uncharacterized protein (DUF488 family)
VSDPGVVWTVGHSTRSFDEFLALLQRHGIRQLVDVRTVPRSRRHPHFSADALAATLPANGIAYVHLPALGGLRKPRRDSINLGWTHESFRGYADYMATPAFAQGLAELMSLAATPTAIMCAEAVWWRCHRQLIADALVARGYEVRHILSERPAEPHRLTSFARIVDGDVQYPGLPGLAPEGPEPHG